MRIAITYLNIIVRKDLFDYTGCERQWTIQGEGPCVLDFLCNKKEHLKKPSFLREFKIKIFFFLSIHIQRNLP